LITACVSWLFRCYDTLPFNALSLIKVTQE